MAQLYVRHKQDCSKKTNPNWKKCGCPLWVFDPSLPRGKQRYSAGTKDWEEAQEKLAGMKSGKVVRGSSITVGDAINLYLKKRSKCGDAKYAPSKDKYMLLHSKGRQQSLKQWTEQEGFVKLEDIAALDLDTWRDTWAFRPNSYAMKIHNAVLKAFFTWCVTYDFLAKNPFAKMPSIEIVEEPTLPLEPEEFNSMLANVTACKEKDREKMTAHILLMRWSGLAVRDASCLRRDALGADNRLRTYRQKVKNLTCM